MPESPRSALKSRTSVHFQCSSTLGGPLCSQTGERMGPTLFCFVMARIGSACDVQASTGFSVSSLRCSSGAAPCRSCLQMQVQPGWRQSMTSRIPLHSYFEPHATNFTNIFFRAAHILVPNLPFPNNPFCTIPFLFHTVNVHSFALPSLQSLPVILSYLSINHLIFGYKMEAINTIFELHVTAIRCQKMPAECHQKQCNNTDITGCRRCRGYL